MRFVAYGQAKINVNFRRSSERSHKPRWQDVPKLLLEISRKYAMFDLFECILLGKTTVLTAPNINGASIRDPDPSLTALFPKVA